MRCTMAPHLLGACILLLAVRLSSAQSSEYSYAWMDTGHTTPEYRAASVVTNLWIAAFGVTSALFGVLGAVVAMQWPNPRILCYKTSYSDMPSRSVRSCGSLYNLNLGFCVFWLLVFAIMVIARDIVRIVVCLCFCLVHTAVVVVFRMKFKRFGQPERPHTTTDMVTSNGSPAGTNLYPGQAVGIPIYDIPLQTVVIGAPTNSSANTAGGPPGQSSYWYDAACMPPQQQPGMYPQQQQQPGATGAAPGAAAGPYPMPGTISYPPQPANSPYPSYPIYPQPGTATAVVAEAAAPGAVPAGAAAVPAAGVPVGAGPSAAAGAGAAAPAQPGAQQQ